MVKTKPIINNKILIKFDLGLSLALFICGVLLVLLNDVSDLEPSRIFNISADLIGLIIISLMFVGMFFDEYVSGHTNRQFRVMLIINVLGFFLDIGAWVFDQDPNYCRLNEWINFGFYMCGVFATAAAWYYLCSVFNDDRFKKFTPFIEIVAAIGIADLVINLGVGHIFYVEKSGIYHRSSFYFLSVIPPALLMLATVIQILLAKRPIAKKIHFLGYFIFPVAGVVVQNHFFGLSVTYVGFLLTNIIIFLTVFAQRGDDLAKKDEEIRQLKEMMNLID